MRRRNDDKLFWQVLATFACVIAFAFLALALFSLITSEPNIDTRKIERTSEVLEKINSSDTLDEDQKIVRDVDGNLKLIQRD